MQGRRPGNPKGTPVTDMTDPTPSIERDVADALQEHIDYKLDGNVAPNGRSIERAARLARALQGSFDETRRFNEGVDVALRGEQEPDDEFASLGWMVQQYETMRRAYAEKSEECDTLTREGDEAREIIETFAPADPWIRPDPDRDQFLPICEVCGGDEEHHAAGNDCPWLRARGWLAALEPLERERDD